VSINLELTCAGRDAFMPGAVDRPHGSVRLWADYDDGQPDHSNWGPQLAFRIVLPADVAEQFEPGARYAVSFTKQERGGQ
jgi:hypothetical protein